MATATATDQYVADLVRDRADHLGLTQIQIARALGISRTALWARLQGNAKWTLSEVQRLSDILGISLYAILDETRDGGDVTAW